MKRFLGMTLLAAMLAALPASHLVMAQLDCVKCGKGTAICHFSSTTTKVVESFCKGEFLCELSETILKGRILDIKVKPPGNSSSTIKGISHAAQAHLDHGDLLTFGLKKGKDCSQAKKGGLFVCKPHPKCKKDEPPPPDDCQICAPTA